MSRGLTMNDYQLLTEAQVAELIGLSQRALQSWRNKGIGPNFVKINNKVVRYRYGDLVAWVNQNTATTLKAAMDKCAEETMQKYLGADQ